MPEFVLTTHEKTWIEYFRDEEMARQAVAKRGAKLTKIVLASVVAGEQIEARPTDIILTTAFMVAGRGIEQEIEVITAECAFGMVGAAHTTPKEIGTWKT